jgi:SpoIID/LytB domain protein
MPRIRALFLVSALAMGMVPGVGEATAQPTRLRFQAPPGESLVVHGEYPTVESSCVDPYQPVLHARYRGTIEIGMAEDGSLFLIGELSFEDYVKGIAEVPRDWPAEALKAQVVAARTYALNRLRFAETGGDYDLCATTECQVYVGMRVEAGPWGHRWVRAVDETAGEVLLYQGEPAITYYSSTSPGRTFDVEDRFGGEALPYLRGVEEPDDRASPLSRWRVEMPFDDLARFLSTQGVWGGGRIDGISASGGSIAIRGAGGGATLSKDGLRDALNESASCLAPDRYPTREPSGYQLPQTVPSVWYRASQEGSALVLKGRGWGHGVGMVQWGAYGKAQRGLSYQDILGAYYGGLRPEPVEVPASIRVLVAEGLREITVAPSGEVEAPGVDARPPWRITGGGRLRVRHGPPPQPLLDAEGFTATRRASPGEPYRATLTASDEVEVHLEFVSGGQVAASTNPAPFEEGQVRLRPPLPDLGPGRYEVRAVVSDGVDLVVTEARPVRVAAAPTVSPSPAPASPPAVAEPAQAEEDRSGLIWAAALAASAVIVLLLLTAARRRGLHRR